MSFFTSSELNLNKIRFGPLKSLGTGKVSMCSVYHGDELLQVQTPELKSPFGVSTYQSDDDKEAAKETLDLNLDSRPNVQKFVDVLEFMQEKAIKHGVENSLPFFGKECSEEFIRDYFSPMIKKPIKKDERGIKHVNTDYPPYFRINLPKRNGQYDFITQDNKHNTIDFSSLNTKGAAVTVIMQCTGMWVGNKAFGFTWKPRIMRVVPKSNQMTLAFKPDFDRLVQEPAEDDMDESSPQETEKQANFLESSDDDEMIGKVQLK